MDFNTRTWAEIDLKKSIYNFNSIKKAAGDKSIMAIVKADSYGHNSSVLAPLYQENGADYFAVSNYYEAISLRNCGITKPILILGYTSPKLCDKLMQYNISQTVYSEEYAKNLSLAAQKSGSRIKIHIKLDTGMGRIGFNCRTFDNIKKGVLSAYNSCNIPCFETEGIFTHYAAADSGNESDVNFTKQQTKLFTLSVKSLKDLGLKFNIIHTSNSAALFSEKDNICNTVRPGIVLYGYKPSYDYPIDLDIKPILSLKSIVSMVKTLKNEETVSYGRTFKTTSPTKIATIPVGYADGYPRMLSNKGKVIIKGQYANIIGRICMDQTMIDVSNIENVAEGDEVILIGQSENLKITAEDIASLCNTISYEVLCGISKRVPRICF